MIKASHLIAHRGGNQLAPENTLAAFQNAKQQGFDWVEFDVQLSQDQVPMVIHDDSVDRTTSGHGAVAAHTYAKLRALKVLNAQTPTAIPSLSETLDHLTQLKLNANIELKGVIDPLQQQYDPISREYFDITLNRRCATLSCNQLKAYLGPQHPQWLVSSFSMECLQIARRILPTIPLAILLHIDDWERQWPKLYAPIKCLYQQLQCCSLNINHECLTQARVQQLQQDFPRLMVYTVNCPRHIQTLLDWGVQSIFTDQTNS